MKTPPAKPVKLLALAADAAVVARNRLADAGNAALYLDDPALNEWIRNLWNQQAEIAETIGKMAEAVQTSVKSE